jgi:hypothetical protein
MQVRQIAKHHMPRVWAREIGDHPWHKTYSIRKDKQGTNWNEQSEHGEQGLAFYFRFDFSSRLLIEGLLDRMRGGRCGAALLAAHTLTVGGHFCYMRVGHHE